MYAETMNGCMRVAAREDGKYEMFVHGLLYYTAANKAAMVQLLRQPYRLTGLCARYVAACPALADVVATL